VWSSRPLVCLVRSSLLFCPNFLYICVPAWLPGRKCQCYLSMKTPLFFGVCLLKRRCVTCGKIYVNYWWISYEHYLIRAWGIYAMEIGLCLLLRFLIVACPLSTINIGHVLLARLCSCCYLWFSKVSCGCERWYPKSPENGWVGSLPDAAKSCVRASTVTVGNHTAI